MEGTKGEERSAEQAASLFGTAEMESQRSAAERRKKRINICKIIAVVSSVPTPEPVCLNIPAQLRALIGAKLKENTPNPHQKEAMQVIKYTYFPKSTFI